MEISAVKLRNSYQINYVDTNSLFVTQNAFCVVETEHGIDVGHVFKCRRCEGCAQPEVKGKLLRLATEEDLKHLPEIETIEKNAFAKCREKAKAKNLDMKLISVKCLFDRTKIIFYFVAENRIDFRELVRELASIFRTRIEMRQIGVRDEARLVGGYGPCGKQLCCVHQSEEFEPVSIKMAKEQSLNLNSLKISGMCGASPLLPRIRVQALQGDQRRHARHRPPRSARATSPTPWPASTPSRRPSGSAAGSGASRSGRTISRSGTASTS